MVNGALSVMMTGESKMLTLPADSLVSCTCICECITLPKSVYIVYSVVYHSQCLQWPQSFREYESSNILSLTTVS